MKNTQIALFQGQKIRKTIYNNEWWFVIADVVYALTDSIQPDGYIKDMRRRDEELSKGWVQIATPLSIQTEGGIQKMNCANTEGIFRIIQSIPSPKAEPFKRWLARVIQNPASIISNFVNIIPNPMNVIPNSTNVILNLFQDLITKKVDAETSSA